MTTIVLNKPHTVSPTTMQPSIFSATRNVVLFRQGNDPKNFPEISERKLKAY